MAFPLGLLVLGALVLGMQWKKPSVDSEGDMVSQQTSSYGQNETKLTYYLDELRSRYEDSKNAAEKYRDLLRHTAPSIYSRMEQLKSNIAATESDLEAKYLFFSNLWNSIDLNEDGISPLTDQFNAHSRALNDLPETSRRIIIEFLKSKDDPGHPTNHQMIAHSYENAMTDESKHWISQHANGALSNQLKNLLKYVETMLSVANNSLPKEFQKNDSLTLTLHVIHFVLFSPTPLTFDNIRPIFLALSKSIHEISQYIVRNSQRSYYSTSSAVANELDFSAVAISDALEKLCDIAVRLDSRGTILKSYYEFYLGDKAKYSTKIGEIFEKLGKVANAAKFC